MNKIPYVWSQLRKVGEMINSLDQRISDNKIVRGLFGPMCYDRYNSFNPISRSELNFRTYKHLFLKIYNQNRATIKMQFCKTFSPGTSN